MYCSDQNSCQIDMSLADRLTNSIQDNILEKCSLENGTITISMENLLENNHSSQSHNVETSSKHCGNHCALENCAIEHCSLETECAIENCSIENRIMTIDNAMEDSMETTRNVLLSEMEEGCMTLGISGCSREDDDISIDSDLLTLKPRIRNVECCERESDVE